MILRRLIQLPALVMIGDGVSGLLKPRWHSLLWRDRTGVVPNDDGWVGKESITKARLLYAAEILVGTWHSTRLTPEKPDLV